MENEKKMAWNCSSDQEEETNESLFANKVPYNSQVSTLMWVWNRKPFGSNVLALT